MKKYFALLIVSALVLTIVVPSFAATVVTKRVVTKTVITMVAGRPHMASAMTKLGEAQKQLEMAAVEYGGHRVKAIGAVKQAIDEINQAYAYANANPGK